MQSLKLTWMRPTIWLMILANIRWSNILWSNVIRSGTLWIVGIWIVGIWIGGTNGTAYAATLATPRNDLNWRQWPKVGEADLRWFVFDVYTSELRSQSGQYVRQQQPIEQNVALKITYHRSISGDDLLQATEEQWQHLGYDSALITQWRDRLATVFPDVQDGDILTFVIEQQRGRFYYRPAAQADWISLGALNDAALSQAFISIWLSPQTAYPELRQKLLGGTQE